MLHMRYVACGNHGSKADSTLLRKQLTYDSRKGKLSGVSSSGLHNLYDCAVWAKNSNYNN